LARRLGQRLDRDGGDLRPWTAAPLGEHHAERLTVGDERHDRDVAPERQQLVEHRVFVERPHERGRLGPQERLGQGPDPGRARDPGSAALSRRRSLPLISVADEDHRPREVEAVLGVLSEHERGIVGGADVLELETELDEGVQLGAAAAQRALVDGRAHGGTDREQQQAE
jgi:hypothetical protein